MSVFRELLATRQLVRHNDHPLWTYALDDAEFHKLTRTLITAVNAEAIDPIDCALYYAEWWKRCYNGGIPSKRQVLDSLVGLRVIDDERFFQLARKGGNLLGIHWIKNQNTLYFKTLLLQGGLPVRHMLANKGSYKNFLLKILEIDPSTVDDFAFDSCLTSYLPPSSRNPEIYECCLLIVKAIMANDEAYLAILTNNQDLKEISSDLQVRKLSLSAPVRKTKIRVAWMLDTLKQVIRLYVVFPEFSTEEFKKLFLKDSAPEQLDYVYKCYYNGMVICKFIKKANGQYKTDWVNQHDLIWDYSAQLPDIYVTSTNGQRYSCNDLVGYLPTLEQPSLWTTYDDTQYTLEKGSHTASDTGYILCRTTYSHSRGEIIQGLELNGQPCHFIQFKDAITVSKDAEEQYFKANSKKIDWYILDRRPKWIKRANYPISSSKPSIVAEDENGKVKYIALQWRQSPSVIWNSWTVPMPPGLTEIQLQVGGVIEYDTFFNIGPLERRVSSDSLHLAKIEMINNPFHFRINENPFVRIDKSGPHMITLHLSTTSRIPHAIHGYLRLGSQSKGLQFEMEPPFHGVAIIDNEGRVLATNTSLTLNKLYGYRLMTNQDDLIVNLSNTAKKDIIISEPLERGLSSLVKLEDKIIQLYALSDIMDSEAEIILELVEQKNLRQTKLAQYRIKRYEQRITWGFDASQQLQLQTTPIQPELFAVPLDCSFDNLKQSDLVNHKGIYTLREGNNTGKFIAFGGREVSLQPEFICSDPMYEQTVPEYRIERISQLRDELLAAGPADEVWQRLLFYYDTCQQRGLAYATFDILRTAGFSSELAARTFIFLAYHDKTQTFIEEDCSVLERDIGFCFHWAASKHWIAGTEWMGFPTDSSVRRSILDSIVKYLEELLPDKKFKQTAKYIIHGTIPVMNPGFHLPSEINKMRSLLGPKALAELPAKCPKIPEEHKSIIGVNSELANVKLLLKSPVTVALSMAGLDNLLWKEENEEIRRHVRYSQLLNPTWYIDAINYCLTKIEHHEFQEFIS